MTENKPKKSQRILLILGFAFLGMIIGAIIFPVISLLLLSILEKLMPSSSWMDKHSIIATFIMWALMLLPFISPIFGGIFGVVIGMSIALKKIKRCR